MAAIWLTAPAGASTLAYLTPIEDAGGGPHSQYWRDITGASYEQSFIGTYTYSAANVWIEYVTYDLAYFTGTLHARGLKPSFCYQMKLDGKPEHPDYYGPDGDDASNEAIGHAGRWWREQPTPGNTDDADYEAHRDDPDYVFTGYLLCDFFVTDANGGCEVSFASDSSYHVCWKESQRAPQVHDGPTRSYNVRGTNVSLYAEWEPTRPYPGDTHLPPGSYNLEFRLTEESFHDPDAFWAQVMRASDVRYTIAPEPGTLCLLLVGLVLLRRRSRCRSSATSQQDVGPHPVARSVPGTAFGCPSRPV